MAGAQRSGSGGLGGTPKGGYGSAPGPFGGFGGAGMGAPKPAEVEPIAQKRFANAKAISSRWVCGEGRGTSVDGGQVGRQPAVHGTSLRLGQHDSSAAGMFSVDSRSVDVFCM
jgi:hypothetical protein